MVFYLSHGQGQCFSHFVHLRALLTVRSKGGMLGGGEAQGKGAVDQQVGVDVLFSHSDDLLVV